MNELKEQLIYHLKSYLPWNEQESLDRDVMLRFLQEHDDCFSRENPVGHFTASAWITDPQRERVLMAYHKLYDAWAWTGGHADGEMNLLSVALKEAWEETGVHARPVTEQIYSLETLNVMGHEKRGRYVPSHLHWNITYLLEADPRASLRIKADENSAVRWFSLEDALKNCSEPWMVDRIYRKLNEKLSHFR